MDYLEHVKSGQRYRVKWWWGDTAESELSCTPVFLADWQTNGVKSGLFKFVRHTGQKQWDYFEIIKQDRAKDGTTVVYLTKVGNLEALELLHRRKKK